MQHAQSAIAVFGGLGYHAKGVDVRQLLKRNMAFLHLFPDRIRMFFAAGDFNLQSGLLHFPSDGLVNLVDFNIGLFADLFQTSCNRLICFGFQLFEREQLHFAHIFIHANPLRQRSEDIHRFFGDTTTFFGAFDEMQRPHIVQAIRKLDQKHADIVRNGQQELAQIFGSAFAFGLRLDFRKLGNAVDQPRDFGTEAAFDIFD